MMHHNEQGALPSDTERSIRDWHRNWRMGVTQNVQVSTCMNQVDALLVDLAEARYRFRQLERDFEEFRQVALTGHITMGGA